MVETPIDVPQMNSSCQENQEASLVCPPDTGLKQSDHDLVHSDHLSCSVPQERFVHYILDGNEEYSEKFEKTISQNQDFGETGSISVPQECFVDQPVFGNAEYLEKSEKGIYQNQEFGESNNISAPQEGFIHQPVVGNAEPFPKFEMVINQNREFVESINIYVPQELSVLQHVDENAELMAKFGEGINRNQEFVEPNNIYVPQERSVLQPVDGNTESLAKFEEGINRNQVIGESKNIFGNDVKQRGWKINVIDDTAVIETVIGGVLEEEFVGFACCIQKSSWKHIKKQETYGKNVNSWHKVQKSSRNGSRTCGDEKCTTRLFENQNVYKNVYQRRFAFLGEQTKKRKSEVHFGSRAYEKRNVLTPNLAVQNMGHKNYPMKNKEGQSSSNVEEQVKNMKTNKVYYGWRKCSRTNWNEKSFTHKFEDQNLFEKKGKGSKRVHYMECSKADSNENIRGNKSGKSKKVYTRDQMEAMRFVGVEEQKKTWAEVYYCGLTPDVMKEYNSLVATSWGKHTQFNFIPKHSILGSFAVKRGRSCCELKKCSDWNLQKTFCTHIL